MNTNTQAVTQSQGGPNRSPSKIELLNAALIALDAEAETKENEVGLDAFTDAYCSQVDAIFDALSFERPKTEREIAIMLRAADHHADLLANTVSEPGDEADRRSRGDKLDRILAALRALFPSPGAGEGLLATA